jgi:hypothetical protein
VSFAHLKSALTAAMQNEIRLYFAKCTTEGRKPLTWDTASIAADAAIELLEREYPGQK